MDASTAEMIAQIGFVVGALLSFVGALLALSALGLAYRKVADFIARKAGA